MLKASLFSLLTTFAVGPADGFRRIPCLPAEETATLLVVPVRLLLQEAGEALGGPEVGLVNEAGCGRGGEVRVVAGGVVGQLQVEPPEFSDEVVHCRRGRVCAAAGRPFFGDLSPILLTKYIRTHS